MTYNKSKYGSFHQAFSPPEQSRQEKSTLNANAISGGLVPFFFGGISVQLACETRHLFLLHLCSVHRSWPFDASSPLRCCRVKTSLDGPDSPGRGINSLVELTTFLAGDTFLPHSLKRQNHQTRHVVLSHRISPVKVQWESQVTNKH